MATSPRKATARRTTTPEEREALAAEREAARKRQANKGTPAEQASISTTSDVNGATKGYIGRDASDLGAEVDAQDDVDLTHTDTRTAIRGALAAAPATYAEPVPPGGHPSDPTSTTSVGAAAESVDKGEALDDEPADD